MSIDSFKAQAHRLQGYIRSNPDAAARLTDGKQSACYEAVAAIHGARNWNTLCASGAPEPASAGAETPAFYCAGPEALDAGIPPDLPPLEVFGEFRRGPTVAYLAGVSHVALSCDVVHAFGDGYRVTTLSAQAELQHLAQAMGGAAGTIEDFCNTNLANRSFLALHFRGPAARPVPWFDISEGGASASVARLTRLMQARTGRGNLLVVEDAPAVLMFAGEGGVALMAMLQAFHRDGGSIVLTGSSLAALKPFRDRLPSTAELVVHATV